MVLKINMGLVNEMALIEVEFLNSISDSAVKYLDLTLGIVAEHQTI
jgi:hypothetical protein